MFFGRTLGHGPLQGYHNLSPLSNTLINQFFFCNYKRGTDLFDEFLLTLLNDQGVGVAHHSDQHVHQQNLNEDYEKDEDGFGDGRIDGLPKGVELSITSKLSQLI